MIEISTTEIQNSFGKYLKLCNNEDIIITRNGKKTAVLLPYSPKENSIVNESVTKYNKDNKKISYEEFLSISNNSENRYEYIDGEIFLMASPSYNHQKLVGKLFIKLEEYFAGRSCENVLSPFDVKLFKKGKINQAQPDLLVICDTENIDEKGKYSGTPDLVIEILSRTNQNHDFITKLSLYMLGGVKEYWVINPFSREVYIYIFEDRAINKVVTYKNNEKASSFIFNGLQIELHHIFK